MKQNKNSVIVRIILWTLTALILLGVLLWGLELLPGLSIRGLSFGGWDFHYRTAHSTRWAAALSPPQGSVPWRSTG